jgi:S-(hydroxymethyl)glutathione dehydrogenase/alcohol dehydrogenase
VPKLIDLYKKGELKLDELISREIELEEVNEAFEAMKTGEVARSVIVYGRGASERADAEAGAAGLNRQ